jgi:hypothetical protein
MLENPKIHTTIEAKVVQDVESSATPINPDLTARINNAISNKADKVLSASANTSDGYRFNQYEEAEKIRAARFNIPETKVPKTILVPRIEEPETNDINLAAPTEPPNSQPTKKTILGKLNDKFGMLKDRLNKMVDGNIEKKLANDKEDSSKREKFNTLLGLIKITKNSELRSELGKFLLAIRKQEHKNWKLKLVAYEFDSKLDSTIHSLLTQLKENLPKDQKEADSLIILALDKLGWENPSNTPTNIARYIGLNGSKSMFITNPEEHKVSASILSAKIKLWNEKQDSVTEDELAMFKAAAAKLQDEGVGEATKQDYIGKKINGLNGLYALLEDNAGNILCFNKEGVRKVYNLAELNLQDTPKNVKPPEIEKTEPTISVDGKISDLVDVDKDKKDEIKPEPSISLEVEDSKEINISKLNDNILELFKNRDVKPGRNVTLIKSIKKAIEESKLDANFAETLEVTKDLSSYYKEAFNSVISGGISIDYRDEKVLSLQDKLIQNYNEYVIKAEKEKQEKIKSDYTKQFNEVFGKVNLELNPKFIDEGIEKLDKPEAAEAFIYKTLADQIVAQYESFKAKKEKDYNLKAYEEIALEIQVKKNNALEAFKDELIDKLQKQRPNKELDRETILNLGPYKAQIEAKQRELDTNERADLYDVRIEPYLSNPEWDFEDYIENLNIKDEKIVATINRMLFQINKNKERSIYDYNKITLGAQLQQAYPLETKEKPKKIEVEELKEVGDNEIEKPKGGISQESMEATEAKLDEILNKIGYTNIKNTQNWLASENASNVNIYELEPEKQESAILNNIATNIIYKYTQKQPENFRSIFRNETVHNSLIAILVAYDENNLITMSGINGGAGPKTEIVKVLEKSLSGK